MKAYDIVLLSLPDWVDTSPTMYFPLSLMYLASSLREEKFKVHILDCRTGIKELPEAKFYGFSCATPQIKIAKQLAKQLKGKTQTIIGGAHASLLPQDCVKDFDYVVKGEGEKILPMILKGWYDKGIIEAPRIAFLDDVPFPAWDMVSQPFSETLFPGERYGKGELAATLIASRGCPMTPPCAFCGNVHQRPVIYRSADSILAELKELKKLGIRHFRFEDDNFTIIPEFERLCNKMVKLDIRYKCHTRSDLMKPDRAELMKLSGCEECGLGVESADDLVLEKVNKKETAEQHKKAISIIKKAGMRAKTYFVMGLPGETDKTVEFNKAFIKETQIDKWTISTFMPYPGCPVFKSPGKFGVRIINNDFSKWWNYAEGYSHLLEGQTPVEMWTRYKKFYEWLRNEENWKV